MSQEFVIIRVKKANHEDEYIFNWNFENGIKRVNKVTEAKVFTHTDADHIIELESAHTPYTLEKVKVTIEV